MDSRPMGSRPRTTGRQSAPALRFMNGNTGRAHDSAASESRT
jgi:hypothetical protein